MKTNLAIILGKTVRRLARLRGGDGSALPGLVVEKFDAGFAAKILGQLPYGVILVSGTNGKTTTTKIISQLLESQNLRVFSNKTGSNFSRGVTAEILANVSLRGELKADVAVLELDEAHAVDFVSRIQPDHTLLLNVMRDQLDRFAEIDYTANLLAKIAQKTKTSLTLNREDPRIRQIADQVSADLQINFFGLDQTLHKMFPAAEALPIDFKVRASDSAADVKLIAADDQQATFDFDDHQQKVKLKLSGIYNFFNAAAALTVVRQVLGSKIDYAKLFKKLAQITPAFGRGESLWINGDLIKLVLVKNPSGFKLGLSSFADSDSSAIMIAINDNHADGRDVSWLWDVSFAELAAKGVLQVGGSRAFDMALRLEYDGVTSEQVAVNLKSALHNFLARSRGQSKTIYCTYTAMLEIRRLLTNQTKLSESNND